MNVEPKEIPSLYQIVERLDALRADLGALRESHAATCMHYGRSCLCSLLDRAVNDLYYARRDLVHAEGLQHESPIEQSASPDLRRAGIGWA